MIIFLFILLFLFAQPVFAGGGRMELYLSTGTYYAYDEHFIKAQVWEEGAHTSFSKNERVEFRIQDPQPGDSCVSKMERTDEIGMIYASCYAKGKRDMTVYLYSFDRGDSSSPFTLYFLEKPSPTPKPTTKPTPSPKISPSPKPSISPTPSSTPSSTPTPIESPTPTVIEEEISGSIFSKKKTDACMNGKASCFFWSILAYLFG